MSTRSDSQYHHYIPRFILRRYKLPPSANGATVQRRGKRDKKKGRRMHVVNQDMVHYFDLDTCKLDIRPVGQVYGHINLYKDIKNVDNANHLEEELSRLESVAATVIKNIHDALGRDQFQVERKALESLRKFLFIMFYRKAALSASYYDENHPENALLAEWLQYVKKKNGLTSQIEVWLHFLQYFLTTPHRDLISRAQDATKKQGFAAFIPSLLPPSEMDDYPAIDYMGISGMYFLGVVQAAEGTEFVMTNNSFGLWEGLILGVPDVHRIFVVSPRVALLLRNNICRAGFGMTMNSVFADVLLEPPKVKYPGGGFSTPEQLEAHRCSSAAQRDVYHFCIVKLTESQTQDMNAIVLLNAKPTGSITFLTKSTMLKTLQAYDEPQHKSKYLALMTELDISLGDGQSNGETTEVGANSSTKGCGTSTSSITDSLNELHISPDAYNRAYKLYSVASVDDPVGQYIFDTIDFLVDQARAIQFPDRPEAARASGSRTRTDPLARLVERLPEAEGVVVMRKMKRILRDVNMRRRWYDSSSAEGLYEAAIVGLLDWLVKNKSDVLASLFPGLVMIV